MRFLLVFAFLAVSWLLLRGSGRRIASPLLRIMVFVPLLSLAALLGILAVRLRASNTDAVPSQAIIDETTPELGTLTVVVTGSGTLMPRRQVPLAFAAGGVVAELLVEEGQVVAEGDVLAALDAADFEAALRDAQIGFDLQRAAFDALNAEPREVDIAAAEAALTAAQASFNAALFTQPSDSDVEIARLQRELAGNQLWQVQLQRDAATQAFTLDPVTRGDLPEDISGVVPDSAIDEVNDIIDAINAQAVTGSGNLLQLEAAIRQSDYGVQIADARYNSVLNAGPDLGALASANAARVQAQVALERLLNGPSEFDLRLAEIDLQRAQLALEQAEASLAFTRLTAPFDGVIAVVNVVAGEPPPNGPAMVLMDPGGYYVDLAVDETDIVNVQVGQRVSLRFDALPDTPLTGTVSRVALTPVDAGQLVTYLTRVILDPNTAPIRVGMSATARITISELESVLILRNRFIRIDRSTQQAYVTVALEGGRYQEIPVTLGLRNETHSQIVSGLEPGQKVVLLERATFNPLG